tara:strand:- start:4 stop:114 length:111 start_codon:yes stop_codon:yes gene_type:complete
MYKKRTLSGIEPELNTPVNVKNIIVAGGIEPPTFGT